MKRKLKRVLQVAVSIGIYSAVLWYSISIQENIDGPLAYLMLGVISLGIAYGVAVAVFKVTGEAYKEVSGGIMVLAEFLNRHLLEPQKQRLLQQGLEQGREEGRVEGQAKERDSIRAKLREQGYDLDKMLTPEENGDAE